MMSDDQVVLRGFDMPMPEIGDQLHFRMPLLSFRSSAELYVAGRVDWGGDIRALTIVDDPEDLEMATLLTDGVEQHVASGEGVTVAGAEFFHAASSIGFPLYGFHRVAVTDSQCWIRVATPSAFVSLKGELVDKSRSVFDRELREAIGHGRRLTERGNAAMLILRRCGPLRSVGLTIRQLSAAMQNRNFHLYRRLIDRLEYELGEPEDRSQSDSESLEVRHDLEDTLRIGASVIDSVAHVMRTMDALSADTKRRCIGQTFEENLKRAAEGVEEIERMFKAICDP